MALEHLKRRKLKVIRHAQDVNMIKMPDFVRETEALGYDVLSVPETKHDPFLVLSLSAEHSRSIRIGPSIALAFP